MTTGYRHGIKTLWFIGAVVGLMSLAACGGKQARSGAAQGISSATFAGTVEPQRFEKTLEPRDQVSVGPGGFYEPDPSYRFVVTKETELESLPRRTKAT